MKISDLAKRMITGILIISLIFIIGSIIYYRSLGFLPFLLGIILGSAASVIKIFLLERAIDMALSMKKEQASKYVVFQHILRLLLTGLVLFLGAVVPGISLWGVVTGILSFQLSVYSVKFKSKN